eukprot:snap_masked-scaffold3337_size9153-processed-gene-0.2 protein:Tk00438 transcript:snap_masked-scaffold3337_size9153-processed-gene-0.2-mRNA-1 annotation:"aldose epimerase"
MEIRLCEYGAILTEVKVPDRQGKISNVILTKPDLASWLDNPGYLGATVGRFGNRIAGGKFTLGGTEYTLATNNDPGGIPCHLHGGTKGFDRVLWNGQPVIRPQASGVTFTYHADDGEEGYPGNLTARVTYWLTQDNQILFEAEATTDAPTPVNLINHTYWNLSGDASKTILDHELQLHASAYLPTTRGLIPTGERAPVLGTPMDFQKATAIGKSIKADFPALHHGKGYDHCWCLDDPEEFALAARVYHPTSGRTLEVHTNQPGLQFYTGNYLPQENTGLCLETQCFPDAPNQPDFPSAILNPGETYRHTTHYRFSTSA